MQKIKMGVVVLGIVFLAAGCGSKSSTSSTSPVVTPTASTTTTTTTNSPASYTMAEVAAANTAQKCWTTIDGNVYDLTTWISQHPGGKANILKLCGIDGAKEFIAQHGTQRKPAQELASLLIGTLKQ